MEVVVNKCYYNGGDSDIFYDVLSYGALIYQNTEVILKTSKMLLKD